MRRTQTKQLTLELRTHGGARRRAGRKPNGPKPGVRHAARGPVGGAVPALVTMKVLADRFDTRIVEFCRPGL